MSGVPEHVDRPRVADSDEFGAINENDFISLLKFSLCGATWGHVGYEHSLIIGEIGVTSRPDPSHDMEAEGWVATNTDRDHFKVILVIPRVLMLNRRMPTNAVKYRIILYFFICFIKFNKTYQ